MREPDKRWERGSLRFELWQPGIPPHDTTLRIRPASGASTLVSGTPEFCRIMVKAAMTRLLT